MIELSPNQRRILEEFTNPVNKTDDFFPHGQVARAFRCMPNTRVLPDFGEPNPDWSLEELEKEGLIEGSPIQGTSEIEWTITPKGAAAIGKILIDE